MNQIAAVSLIGKYIDVTLKQGWSGGGVVALVLFTANGTEIVFDSHYAFDFDSVKYMIVGDTKETIKHYRDSAFTDDN